MLQSDEQQISELNKQIEKLEEKEGMNYIIFNLFMCWYYNAMLSVISIILTC